MKRSRRLASKVLPRTGLAGPNDSTATLQRFRQIVELHYRDNLSIEVFEKLLGVTRAHLHDACHRSACCTPLKLIHERLLDEARLRLENTEFPVEQIAYGLGFRDPGYFNRFFKRLTGFAPGAYRNVAAARSTIDAPSFAAWAMTSSARSQASCNNGSRRGSA